MAAIPLRAEQAFNKDRNSTSLQRTTPAEGPGAAFANPAALGETHWAYAGYGSAAFISGKGKVNALQMAVATPPEALPWLPLGIALGFGHFGNASSIDGNNAIYLEEDYTPGLALYFPAGAARPFRFSVAVAGTFSTYNAFGALRTKTLGLDAGTQAIFPTPFGRLRLGYTYHHLNAPRVYLPDEGLRGFYEIKHWTEHSLGWTSPAARLKTHLELFINAEHDPVEGPSTEDRFGVHGWGVEARPRPWFGIQAERNRIGSLSTVGAVFYPPIPLVHLQSWLSFGIGHERFNPAAALPDWKISKVVFGEAEDDGRGFLFDFALGAGI